MVNALAVIALLPALAASRDTVSFDFGWQHRTGLHGWADPDEPPPDSPDPGPSPDEARPGYDASGWKDVHLPHDGLIEVAPSATACPDGCSGRSYIPRHVLWYRKEFSVPSEWDGSAFWLDFEGSFRLTTVWINGEVAATHDCGYTPFRVRLDNITNVKVGGKNVVAVFVDPDNGDTGGRDHGSGWWYEGGGLYRHVSLTRASMLHVEQDGLFAYSNVSWATSGSQNAAASGTVHASASLLNGAASALASACASVSFSLAAPDGSVAATATAPPLSVAGGASGTARATLLVKSPLLWSSPSPSLYTLTASLAPCATAGSEADGGADGAEAPTDAVWVSHGFRELRYDADAGFFLNRAHFKVRGFCDHNSFAVVGMAVPARIGLFRAQASRAVGGNGRRTSHNPPDVSMLQIYDRIGVVVMDENRLFENNSRFVTNMGAMVKRDRNHPAVVIWSFCNEAGCEGAHEKGGPAFRAISYDFDGSRPTLANMFTFGDLLSNTIDVQGFSHQSRAKLDDCHAKLPHKPVYMSECCSCNTMRDEDEGRETTSDNPHNTAVQKSFNARCAESNSATNASDGVAYAVGTMVWTLFDYYGEPPAGGVSPDHEVSSTYGQYDLCGFPKAAAFWYRTQWLLTVADGADKTFPTRGKHEVHLVESWESPDAFPSTVGNKTRAVHAYTSAPSVELFVNGASVGSRAVARMVDGAGSYAEWLEVPWETGTLSAVAHDASGAEVATAARHTNADGGASLSLTLDAPHVDTGTGTALLLDGHDAALLRATVLDANGRRAVLAAHDVSFRVVSGPGALQGTHNGDPHAHLPGNASTHPAYHGLVRAVVRVTSVAARPAAERALAARIDARGPMAATTATATAVVGAKAEAAEPIVVEASAPGFAPARLSIPTSTDADAHGVLASASAAAGKPVDFFAADPQH